MLFPGGGGDYLEYGRNIYNHIKEYNDNDTYFPMWGTCLGLENIAIYESKEGETVLENFPIDYGSLSLKFLKNPKDT